MGSYFGRNQSPKPSNEPVHSSYPYLHAHSSSPVSQTAPVLPPIPSFSDVAHDARPTGLGLDAALTFDPSPQQSTPSSSSNRSTPSPLRDAAPTINPAVRPQSLQKGRAVTSPVGALPSLQQSNLSPASPLAALSVPYTSTTAQAKPRAGNRPLPAESTINGVPQHAKTSKQRPELHSNKSSKGKFNLLNPVNLLMRRRSAQAVETLEKTTSKNLVIPPMDLPDDYDPRIRGNVVHDFSAPRTRRTPSYDPSLGEASTKPSTANESIKSQQESVDRDSKRQSVQHTPIFVEHIDSEPDADRVHAETLANNDFVARNSWQQSGESLHIPPFGRRSQLLEEHSHSEPASDSPHSAMSAMSGPGWQYHEPERVYSPLSPEPAPESLPEQGDLKSERNDPDSLSAQQLPQPSPDLLPNPSSTLPRHMTSTASRFSFQIANDSIAEEKLLEERHKLRQSNTAQDPPTFEHDEYEDEEEDAFDEDAMYDHDEMEDAPAKGFYEHLNSGLPERLSTMTLDSGQGHLSVASSSTLYSTTAPSTIQPALHNPLRSNPPPGSLQQQPAGPLLESSSTAFQQQPARPSSANSFYFDDGMIEQLDDVHEEEEDENDDDTFDETKFDDPSYLKRPNQPPHLHEAPAPTLGYVSSDAPVHNVNGYPFLIQNPGTGHFSAESPFSESSSQPSASEQQREAQDEAARHDSQQGPPDCHSLSAYHSALAEAAHRAAADGKFTRQNSITASDSAYSEDYEQDDNNDSQQSQYPQAQMHMPMPMPAPMQMQIPPYTQMQMPQQSPYQMQLQMQMQMQMQPQMRQSYMSASSHASRGSYSAFDFGFSDGATIEDTFSSPEFPNDDFAFDDSDLISAANSEALANDDEGFYSQEFGFYARARPGGDPDAIEAINGGYFGAPGIEIVRQKSVKEPNLTPITERSEFSTRNSYIGPFSPLAAALPSPGFPPAHMAAARMSPLAWQHLQEDEMTLADLRRLKQGAFGSSSNSVNSLSSSFGVPAPYSPTMAAQNMPGGYFMPRASGSVPMAWQRSSDSNSNYNPSNHSSSPAPTSPIHTSMPNGITNSQPHNSPLQPPFASFVADNVSTPKKSSNTLHELPGTPVTAKKAAAKDTATTPERQSYQTHSRSGSGADNITYVREEDSTGGKRWVLERRRTSEAGLLELIGREVVEGGRI
ncbi:hypothetical protein E4T50_07022 [Aureobasidium sp. EXF-12298]|nr:hypothetical protein E4T50_07022 [Aureobasidium sp. EXF-12298]KAI4759370.1 hypothetical protein E4T51_07584 [Aureobasidium sp. EXF-12344]KAI4776267.1 hypothetical protein E4T52_08803 [Aureobasidium sp. EXF-3400]